MGGWRCAPPQQRDGDALARKLHAAAAHPCRAQRFNDQGADAPAEPRLGRF